MKINLTEYPKFFNIVLWNKWMSSRTKTITELATNIPCLLLLLVPMLINNIRWLLLNINSRNFKIKFRLIEPFTFIYNTLNGTQLLLILLKVIQIFRYYKSFSLSTKYTQTFVPIPIKLIFKVLMNVCVSECINEIDCLLSRFMRCTHTYLETDE